MHKRVIIPSGYNQEILYASKTKIEGDFSPALHKHPNLEILYVFEGKGYLQSTNRKIELKQGEVILINKDVPHFENSPDSSLGFYAIGIKDIQAYLKSNLEKKILYYQTSAPDDFSFLFRKIYQEIEAKQEGYLQVSTNLLKGLFIEIKRELETDFQSIDTKQYSYLIASVLSILDNHFFEDITVSILAKRLGVSKSYLSHLFKQEIGESIIQYKIKKQLEEADNLLRISDLPITDIAFQVGIHDLSYFIKQYKDHYGMTPLNARTLKRV